MGINQEDQVISELKVKRNAECASCDKMFMYKSELKAHVKAVHLKIKDLFCDNCGKRFSSKSHLNSHLSTHLDNSFQCNMCGVKLARKTNLINHIKTLHNSSVEEPKIEQSWSDKIPCHVCGKTFNNTKNLGLHVSRGHDVLKREKVQTFSNSFKVEVLEKVAEVGVLAALKVFGNVHEATLKGWVSLARGDHSCEDCGKFFTSQAQLKSHRNLHHERDKSEGGHRVAFHSMEVKREVVASARAASNIKETARKFNIEESTIRAWMKKLRDGSENYDSRGIPKKGYFQQKYREQLKAEVVECSKTMSRKEIQTRFNVPGPTIRMWLLQAQGLPYLKRVSKSKYEGSLKDFLLASGKQFDIKSEAPKQSNIKSKIPHERSESFGAQISEIVEEVEKDQKILENFAKLEEVSFEQGLKIGDLDEIFTNGKSLDSIELKFENSPEKGENFDQEVINVNHLQDAQQDNLEMLPTSEQCQGIDCELTTEDLDEIYTNEKPLGGIDIKSDHCSEKRDENNLDNDNHTDAERQPKIQAHSPVKNLKKQETLKKKRTRKRTVLKGRCFKCDQCGSEFSRVQELTRHKKIHTGKCPFRCSHCKAGFKAEAALRAHKNSIHNDQTMMDSESDVRLFGCNQCDSRFHSATAFGKHMKLLHDVGNPFICDKCGIGMSTPDNLKRHVLVAHTDKKPFSCEECIEMFGTKSQLTKHQLEHAKTNGSLNLEQERVLREQSEKRICDLCGKKLSCAVTLQRHMRIHDSIGTKFYTCEECGKAYSDKRNLSDHISIVHRQVKKFPCAICGKQFGRRCNLQDHVKRTHNKRVI